MKISRGMLLRVCLCVYYRRRSTKRQRNSLVTEKRGDNECKSIIPIA